VSAYTDYAALALHAYSPHNDHGNRFDDLLDAYAREREACQKIEDAQARSRFHDWRRRHAAETELTA
jgi:hypothetical protein